MVCDMSRELFGISFAAWQYYPYILLVLLLGGLALWAGKKRMFAIRCLADTQWQSILFKHYSPILLWIKFFLYSMALLLLFVALLRPQWGTIEQNIEQEGRDLMIALDVSRSMLAQDRKPNRLAFAKSKIKQLVQRLDCERIGLILCSGSTVVQCPLTSDFSAFFMFLDQLDAETISSGTTAIDEAIKKALEVFARFENKKNKLLVLFTDGEDFSSNLAQIKQRAAQQGLHIFTIGVGTSEGAPIPLVDDEGNQIGHQRDAKGQVVISRLNEGILQTLADESGGIYLLATEDSRDMITLLNHVVQFEKEKFDDKTISSLQDQYPYLVAGALTCLLLEWLL